MKQISAKQGLVKFTRIGVRVSTVTHLYQAPVDAQ